MRAHEGAKMHTNREREPEHVEPQFVLAVAADQRNEETGDEENGNEDVGHEERRQQSPSTDPTLQQNMQRVRALECTSLKTQTSTH